MSEEIVARPVLPQVCIAIDNRAHAAVAPDEKAGATAFLRNITGMAFYSTPHGGARLADNAVVQVMAGGAAMTYLETLNKDTSRINTAFAELPTRTKWHTLGFCEQHATKVRVDSLCCWSLAERAADPTADGSIATLASSSRRSGPSTWWLWRKRLPCKA